MNKPGKKDQRRGDERGVGGFGENWCELVGLLGLT